MRREAAIVLAAVGLLAMVRLARAEGPDTPLPTDPTLARLIAESLSARPEIAKSRSLVAADEQQIPQVAALPDPMLQLGIQNDGVTSIEIGKMGTSFISLMGSQTFPWPGKRGLRKEVAALGAQQSRQAVVRLQLSTEADVRRAYLELLLARERLALLASLDDTWQHSLGIARARYITGDGAQSDVLRAQLEIARLAQRRLALTAQERSRVQAINRLRAHPLDEPIETSTHLRDLAALASFEDRFSAARAVASSPEIAAARLGATRAARSVALSEKGSLPDLTVAAGIMFRGTMQPMWLVTVGGPLPVFAHDKQDRAIAEDRARESAARDETAAIEQLVRLRSEQRHTAFAALLGTIEVYRGGLLVQSQATTESTLAQYKVGKVSFASVLEANAGYIADQEGFLEAVAAAYQILIAEAEISLDVAAMPAEPSP